MSEYPLAGQIVDVRLAVGEFDVEVRTDEPRKRQSKIENPGGDIERTNRGFEQTQTKRGHEQRPKRHTDEDQVSLSVCPTWEQVLAFAHNH